MRDDVRCGVRSRSNAKGERDPSGGHEERKGLIRLGMSPKFRVKFTVKVHFGRHNPPYYGKMRRGGVFDKV